MICSSLITRFRFWRPVVSTLTQVHRSEVTCYQSSPPIAGFSITHHILLDCKFICRLTYSPQMMCWSASLQIQNVENFLFVNVLPRLVFWSLSIAIATTLAAMFPFFGDIDAVIGAFGCIPLDIILSMVLYNVTFKSSKLGLMFGINTLIATIFSALGVLGAISSIRQIVLDAKHL